MVLRGLWAFVGLCLLAVAACGCGRPVEESHPGFGLATREEARNLAAALAPGRQELQSWEEMRPAVERSLRYVTARPQQEPAVDRPELRLTWGDLGLTLTRLLELLPELGTRPEVLNERFVWCRLDPAPLLTGYYEPVVEADLTRSDRYSYPLYGVPPDLKSVSLERFHPRWKGETLIYRLEKGEIVPYFDRHAIDGQGALSGKKLELAWAADPVDVFFLQIQGSGRLLLPDGSERRILYAGKNGLPYVSLGKHMADLGIMPLDQVSMQRIKAYLNEHPERREELLSVNPSYVFFRLGEDGPFGSMGELLTTRVSVATDPKVFPLGSVLAVATDLSSETPGDARPDVLLCLAQDRGGAIQGGRLDFFAGSGQDAGSLAGRLKVKSPAYLLVAREVFDGR